VRPVGERLPTPPALAPSTSRVARAFDFVSDWAVLGFAVWTLIAYAGMVTEARVSVLVPVWLATLPLLGIVLVALSRRSENPAAREQFATRRRAEAALGSYFGKAALAAGLVSAVLAAAWRDAPWALVWAGAAVAVALAVGAGHLRSDRPASAPPVLAWPAHAAAAFVGLCFATMSLFINRSDGDDAFYVNRATGTEQLNRIPVRDIIFTDERVDPVFGTGLPVDTFSALQGALGRFIGIDGASVAYYVTPPLMTFFATWALWRLLRSWAPRNVLLCFALGCLYWLFSAQDSLTPGSFFLSRMWQGKVIFAAWLVLTAYVYLTRWLAKRDGLTAALVLAAGIASIGMTSSAAFVAPLLFAAAALPLLARGDWRGVPVLLGAAAFPFLVGFVVSRNFPLEHIAGRDVREIGTDWYFHEVFGVGLVAALGVVALWAAPWLARSGSAAALTAGIAVVTIVLLAPAVLPTLNDLTGLASVLRRVLWVVPFPALVGLLAALPAVPFFGHLRSKPALLRRAAAGAPALLAACLLVAFGQPLWSLWRTGESLWTLRPAWKVNQTALRDARAILARYSGRDPVLADERIMFAIALVTVQPKAVNARSFYARLTPDSPQRISDRLALTRFVSAENPTPSRRRVERALADLRVGLVCIDESRPLIIREVEALGNYGEAFRVRQVVCFERRGPPGAVAVGASAPYGSTHVRYRSG
jgi:hypothetical protein